MSSRLSKSASLRLSDRYLLNSEPLVVVMGVSGSGKSTIGVQLAQRLVVPFIDGDDLHPAANIDKMSRGLPLTGDDRRPWLESVGAILQKYERTGLVVACSALRVVYRDIIRDFAPRAFFLHLDVPREALSSRMSTRADHFMPLSLLEDQLLTLEPLRVHESGYTVRADRDVDRILRESTRAVRARKEYI